MADDAPKTLAERIAALNMAQAASDIPSHPPPSYEQATYATHVPLVGRKRPPPPTPPRPALPARPQTSNVPASGHVTGTAVGNQPEADRPVAEIARPPLPARTSTQSSQASQSPVPNLPPRRPSEQPALPSRRPSDALSSQTEFDRSRRGSNASASSVATTRTSLSAISDVTSASDRYRIRAPEYDPSALPALPPKRTKEEKEADSRKYAGLRPLRQTKSNPKTPSPSAGTTPPPPARPAITSVAHDSVVPPPIVPHRSTTMQSEREQRTHVEPPPPARPALVPPPALSRPRKSALDMGFGNSNVQPPIPTGRPGSVPQTNGSSGPPPIPAASKPDLAALQASKPKPTGAAYGQPSPAVSTAASSCLRCRDFSGPDHHAARFAKDSLPHQDVGWLAQQLTAPFPSLTDKARALFTWLHHNVAYDTYSFFNNCVKPSTPHQVLTTGLAVCEGYAGLFNAMALKVGLEAIVVGGASKGFGHSQLKPGESLRPFKSTHAWNAVRIDNGEWKLIDCCWGAGHLGGADKSYHKKFSPERFTQSNDEFGLDHFPEDATKQMRNDGRTLTWEQFTFANKDGCGASFFGGLIAEEGLLRTSFQPNAGKIALAQQGPTVRFAFQKICPHWDPMRNGKGPYYLYILKLDGVDGGKDTYPFETNGEVWWCDVRVQYLVAGQKASIWAMTEWDKKSGRGLTIDEYRRRKGRVASNMGGVCMWDIV